MAFDLSDLGATRADDTNASNAANANALTKSSFDLSDLGATRADNTQSNISSGLTNNKLNTSSATKNAMISALKAAAIGPLSSVNPSILNKSTPFNQLAVGAGQEFANTGIGAADLLPGVNIKPITSWSDNSIPAKVGSLGAGIGAFVGGGELLKGALALPKVGSGLNAARTLLSSTPTGSKIAGLISNPITKEIGVNALMGAVQNPEHQLMGAGIGGAFGLGGGIAGKLLSTANPIVKAVGGAALGGTAGLGIGAAFGHPYVGAELGGLAGGIGALFPGAAQRGASAALDNINLKDVATKRRLEASKNLNVPITPAEASQAPSAIALEGQISNSPTTAADYSQLKDESLGKQKDAVSGLLNDISPTNEIAAPSIREAAQGIQSGRESTIKDVDQKKIDTLLGKISPVDQDVSSYVRSAAQDVINKQKQVRAEKTKPLYDLANKETIPGNSFAKILQDPNLSKLQSDVISDTSNIYDLKGFEPNSIKVLDLMRQDLNGRIDSESNPNEQRKLMIQKNLLDDITQDSSANIQKARAAYQKESKPVNDLQNGIIGKLANLDDTQLKSVASQIFDRKQTNIDDFNKVRNSLSKQNPYLWRAVIKNAIQDRIDRVKNGDPGSVFYKNILGSKRDYDQFNQAAQGMPDVQKQLSDLKTQLPESSQQMKTIRKTMISRLANTTDSQLKNISSTIFDPNQVDSKMFTELRDQISKQNPTAWLQIVRNEMERRLQGDTSGSNFYKTILKNENSYNQFMSALNSIPKAQQKLTDMRDLFSGIINAPTREQITEQGRQGIIKTKFRSLLTNGYQLGNELLHGKFDKGVLNVISNPEWDKEFNEIKSTKSYQEKVNKAASLFTRAANVSINTQGLI